MAWGGTHDQTKHKKQQNKLRRCNDRIIQVTVIVTINNVQSLIFFLKRERERQKNMVWSVLPRVRNIR